jgi:hypothetical protein
MVKRVAGDAGCSATIPTDPGELALSIRHALTELSRTRPRIVSFAPHIALQRVLAHSDFRDRLRPARRALTARGCQPRLATRA